MASGATAVSASLGGFMLVMLISGTFNTLLMKFMVMQEVPTSAGAKASGFDHPFTQSLFMMFGEFLCLCVYYCTRRPGTDEVASGKCPKYIFGIACLFDWTATTLVNMAYGIIAASVVQMTRGAIVIFTCLFSVIFLGRRQHAYHLAGVFLVFVGITLVSLSTFINPTHTGAPQTEAHQWAKLFGISLCIGAQVFQASMIVYEEKIMSKYTVPPLQVVGLEGAFGILFGVVLLTFLHYFRIENPPAAFYQMTHSTPLAAAIVASIISIAFFNFSGVTVTQQASAVARSTIDVSRTILIWGVEMALGWNSFNILQFAGFVVLAVGTMLYNRMIIVQCLEPSAELTKLKENVAV